ncbi:hypothetical protein D3C73_1618900 [compost metagenome]
MWKLNSCIERAWPVSSSRPIVSATEEYLMVPMNSDVSGGSTMRNASGRMM